MNGASEDDPYDARPNRSALPSNPGAPLLCYGQLCRQGRYVMAWLMSGHWYVDGDAAGASLALAASAM